jgi:hypothetical protein
MNSDKAKEYFSAFYEGTLDRGLAEAFERRLASDAALASEYRRFAALLDAIGPTLSYAPEPPSDLHEKIAARLDRHMFDERQKARSGGVGGLWRSLAWGGAAVLAVVSAITSFTVMRGVQTASLTGAGAAKAQMEVGMGASGAVVTFFSKGETAVEVRSGLDGPVVHRANPRNEEYALSLPNSDARGRLVTVIRDGRERISIVLPGVSARPAASGQGTLGELAIALADYYDVPVVLEASQPSLFVMWKFVGKSASDAVRSELSAREVRVTLAQTGVLQLVQTR